MGHGCMITPKESFLESYKYLTTGMCCFLFLDSAVISALGLKASWSS